MKNQIKQEAIPVMFKIINDAELQLSQLAGMKIKLEMVNKGEILSKKEANRITLQNLISDAFNLPWPQIITRNRKREVVNARKAYCFIAYNILGNTLTQIARDINRDHTSVIHLKEEASRMIFVKDELADYIDDIKTKLYENIN